MTAGGSFAPWRTAGIPIRALLFYCALLGSAMTARGAIAGRGGCFCQRLLGGIWGGIWAGF